jgi:hypothetical protein
LVREGGRRPAVPGTISRPADAAAGVTPATISPSPHLPHTLQITSNLPRIVPSKEGTSPRQTRPPTPCNLSHRLRAPIFDRARPQQGISLTSTQRFGTAYIPPPAVHSGRNPDSRVLSALPGLQTNHLFTPILINPTEKSGQIHIAAEGALANHGQRACSPLAAISSPSASTRILSG